MDLKQTLLYVITGAILLLPVSIHAADPNMQRTLNLAYGNEGGPQITNYNSSTILSYIEQIKPNASAIIPLMLNVPPSNIYKYRDLLKAFEDSKIPIYPALGDSSRYEINSSYYRGIARAYRKFTDCIQLDSVQNYTTYKNGINKIIWMIDYLNNTLGFQHIQLNAWPIYPNHSTAYSFSNPAVDSAMEQVILNNSDSSPYTVYKDAQNWEPNAQKISMILAANPTAQIIINYENKPQEASLDTLSTAEQIDAFKTTIRNIDKLKVPSGLVHWTPPWSLNYDPIANKTWTFITRQLNKGNP